MGLSQSFKRRKESHYASPGSGLPQPAGAISDMLVSKPFRGDPRNYESCQQGRGSTHTTKAGVGLAQHRAHSHPWLCPPLGFPDVCMETKAQVQVSDTRLAMLATQGQSSDHPQLCPPSSVPRVPPTQSSLHCPTQGDSQLGPSSQVV